MFIYLKANGYIINTTLEEKKSLIIDIASGEKSFEDIVNWLRVYAEEI
ncbi:toxin-antitoxin system, toxin component, Fic family [Veillonella sp. oral taxon 780 str. F0422]|nr:toxin-antitoxin system, toxin component, Fic family [Veillonella sp. oral taxon 780 str. F0422]